MVGVSKTRPPKPDAMIGRVAAGYVIERLLGEGGMGAVYEATCPLIGQRAAVKVMLGEFSNHKEALARFSREAKSVSAVRDPNVITVYSAGRFAEDDRMFIVMEFIEGGSLDQLWNQRGPLSIGDSATIILQVCSALEAVHELGIVHRDIKGQNILVTPLYGRELWVKLVDFGIVKMIDPGNAETFRTRTMATIGTPGCMAPEQAAGRDIDARADIYSVGVVLYQMLTGAVPFPCESFAGWMEKVSLDSPFPRPRERRPEIPQIWDDLIVAMLRRDRELRPATAREVGQRIAAGVPDGHMLLRTLAPRLRGDIGATQIEGMAPLRRRLPVVQRHAPAVQRHARVQPPSQVRQTMPLRPPRAVDDSAAQQPVAPALAVPALVAPALVAPALAVPASAVPVSAVPVVAPRSRFRLGVPLALSAVLGGSVFGFGLFKIVSGRHTSSPSDPVASATLPTDARELVTRDAAVELDAGVIAPTDAAIVSNTIADAAVMDAASIDVVAPSHPAPPDAGSSAPARPEHPRPHGDAGQLAARPVATTGTLVVKVATHGEVYVDETYAGTTPVVKLLSVGEHRVKLIDPNKHEDESSVTIAPGKTTTVARNW